MTICLFWFGCTAERGPESIIVVSVDTLRADHLGCYGYQRDTSPFLDEMAESSVLFEQTSSSAPWTLPAHASLLTGLYPSTHRAVDAESAITSSVALAAELYRAAGFATGAVVTSFFVSGRYGFDRGFDWFEDFDRTSKATVRQKVLAEEVVDEATRWLESVRSRQFFLFIHFYDPHYDYNPPPIYRDLFDTGYVGERPPYWRYSHYKSNPLAADLLAHEISLYDGEIRYVDDQIRRLVETLEGMGLRDSTLLVVTSDHGEEFFERGSWGHAHTLYDEQIRVPLIVSGPGVSGPRRISSQVRHIDLLPTLLEAVGVPIPEGVDGESLWPLLQGGASKRRIDHHDERPAFFETSRFSTNLVGMRDGRWKFIADFSAGQDLLFDLVGDPTETENLARTEARIASGLRTRTMVALERQLPDLWVLRWLTSGGESLVGELHTSGALIAPSSDGQGRTELKGPRTVQFRLEPGEALSFRVVPVDAKVILREAPTARGRAIPVYLGRSEQPAARYPFRISSRQAILHSQSPVAVTQAAILRIQPSRRLSEEVVLDPEERRRLEALGYLVQ